MSGRGRGVSAMMVVVLIAGIGLVVAGLATVGLGIQLDLSFGNTLLLAGAIVACTGVLMLGLWIALRELKAIALQLSGLPAPSRRAGSLLPSAGSSAGDQAPEHGGFLFSHDQPAAEHASHVESGGPSPAPPWHEEAGTRGRGEVPAPEPVEAAPAAKPRRNLLFSSSSRKERERAEARAAEPSVADLHPGTPGPASPAAAPVAESVQRRPRPSMTPGRSRSARGRPTRPCRAAAAGPHRRSAMRRLALPQPIAPPPRREARISRRSPCSNRASSMEWRIRCIPTVRSRRKCPKA